MRVFTTRPDTTFGVTFMVLAPEHPLVLALTAPERQAEVRAYIDRSRRLTEIERLSTEKEKDGVFTGAYVTNRLNGEKVPLWMADYVLATYGTGAVMAVPAHDERDFAFAKKYSIPIRVVISPPDWHGEPWSRPTSSRARWSTPASSTEHPAERASRRSPATSKSKGWGKGKVTYRMRDWLISRQRYWGAPIPMVYCEKDGIVPVPEKDLPVLLPDEPVFRATGESPLKYDEKFVNTTCPKCGGPAKRETDTIDGFLCSCWYFLRYCSPDYDQAAFDPARMRYWMPVDIYTGGAEHAVMHLLYARFFTMAIRDMGLVPFGEPFSKLFNQGTIVFHHEKMSKSRGNVVNPDEYVSELGADTVRAYMMFIGPWEQGGEWFDTGISGVSRWLNRVWNLALDEYQPGKVDPNAERELARLTHQTIRRVTGDMDRLRFNTMLAALMEMTNELARVKEAAAVSKAAWDQSVASLVLMLAPTAPHLAEELWEKTGHPYSIHNQRWPAWDEALAKEEEITLVVQVNGKVRDRISVPASISEEEAKAKAMASPKVKPYLDAGKLASAIYVPGRLVNLVVK